MSMVSELMARARSARNEAVEQLDSAGMGTFMEGFLMGQASAYGAIGDHRALLAWDAVDKARGLLARPEGQ